MFHRHSLQTHDRSFHRESKLSLICLYEVHIMSLRHLNLMFRRFHVLFDMNEMNLRHFDGMLACVDHLLDCNKMNLRYFDGVLKCVNNLFDRYEMNLRNVERLFPHLSISNVNFFDLHWRVIHGFGNDMHSIHYFSFHNWFHDQWVVNSHWCLNDSFLDVNHRFQNWMD